MNKEQEAAPEKFSDGPFYREIKKKKKKIPAEKKMARDLTDEGIEKIVHDAVSTAEGFFDGKIFISKKLGDKILENTHIKTLKGSGEIYHYQDGVYLKDGKEKIKQLCINFLQELYTRNRFLEVVSWIEGCTYIDPGDIDNVWVNMENGLVDPITKEFKEHTPEIFSTIRIPITYDPKAKCPLFKEKLKEKIDKPTLDVVQEMFGYVYLPKQRFEKAFLFYGPKKTMKSTTLHILGKMLGSENVAARSLQFISNDRFGIGYLYGKPANICADLSPTALKETGIFLALTGGDKISGQVKFGHQMDFYPSTKLIFSCNEIPPTYNKNLPFYRRWILLEFKKQTPEQDIDSELKEKLEAELPGIFNWALEGLARLLEKDGFGFWLSDEEIKDLYEKGSDPIQSFIFNRINTEDDEGVLKKRVVYNDYKNYCREEGLRIDHQVKFGRMFLALTGCGVCKESGLPAYKGVSNKEGEESSKITDY